MFWYLESCSVQVVFFSGFLQMMSQRVRQLQLFTYWERKAQEDKFCYDVYNKWLTLLLICNGKFEQHRIPIHISPMCCTWGRGKDLWKWSEEWKKHKHTDMRERNTHTHTLERAPAWCHQKNNWWRLRSETPRQVWGVTEWVCCVRNTDVTRTHIELLIHYS